LEIPARNVVDQATSSVRKIRVKIPQGVGDGSRVRIAGKGEPGMNGGQPGDLYLIIRVKPHPVLTRKGDDLYMEVPVTVHEAMAGGTISVPTVDGQVKVKVPPKSQSGQTLRLKGKGAFNPKKKKRGDIMIKLMVKVPRTDDRNILDAAKKMEPLYTEDIRKDVRL
jgi:molecular chaperone DnaJ